MHSIENRLSQKLGQRIAQNSFRSLPKPQNAFDFCSNDYLGLARNVELWSSIQEEYQKISAYLIRNGSTGSRLLGGNYPETEQVEALLGQIFKAESCLLFNSGYAANSSLLAAITDRQDVILYDEYIHASLKEGYRLSFASKYAFRHNDLNDLEQKLKKHTSNAPCLVVMESVYSMDGDMPNLQETVELCEKYGAALILDEAHSTGLWGENGQGLACLQQLENRILARVYTFGKGMGVQGACVAGSNTLIQYLINFGLGFIYTTALPLHSVVSIRCAFAYLASHLELQQLFHDKIRYYAQLLHEYQLPSKPQLSGIQTLEIGEINRCKTIAQALQHQGFDVKPILSPTVKAGSERLRICLHTYNEDEDIRNLVEAIKIISNKI